MPGSEAKAAQNGNNSLMLIVKKCFAHHFSRFCNNSMENIMSIYLLKEGIYLGKYGAIRKQKQKVLWAPHRGYMGLSGDQQSLAIS